MALQTLSNGQISVTISDVGAELMSIQTADGTEYLWQGDPRYWADRAPILFPFIARLTNDSYTFMGKTYPMTIHGFANASEFTVASQAADRLALELRSSEKTLTQYPIDFVFRVIFRLDGDTLHTIYHVENKSAVTMPCSADSARYSPVLV